MEDKINQFIENQQKALADFKTQLLKELSPKTEFEVGKWYYVKGASTLEWLFNFHSQDGSIINSNGVFIIDKPLKRHDYQNTNYTFGKLDFIRRATESEVKEALEKEWKKQAKGTKYIDNAVLLGHSYPNTNNEGNPLTDEYEYNSHKDALTCKTLSGNFWTVYSKGKFAKPIVKEEAIKIGGYEVKFDDRIANTTIEGYGFGKEFWEAALKISEHSKAGVYVGCDAKILGHNKWYVSPEQIKSILEKLK